MHSAQIFENEFICKLNVDQNKLFFMTFGLVQQNNLSYFQRRAKQAIAMGNCQTFCKVRCVIECELETLLEVLFQVVEFYTQQTCLKKVFQINFGH